MKTYLILLIIVIGITGCTKTYWVNNIKTDCGLNCKTYTCPDFNVDKGCKLIAECKNEELVEVTGLSIGDDILEDMPLIFRLSVKKQSDLKRCPIKIK